MKIKTKLIISFCIIIFVPVFLAAITIIGFCNFQTHVIEETYGIKNANAYSIMNSVQLLNKYTVGDFEKIKRAVRQNSQELLDTDFLQDMNSDLLTKYSYLIVRVGKSYYYNGGADNESILDSLPEYGKTGSHSGVGIYIDSEEDVLVKQVDFENSAGKKTSVFIITSMDESVPEVRQLVLGGVIAVILILLMTAVMMIIWIYQSMITPIKKLRVAAENIKEGNLDFEMDVRGDDEIGELCVTFEEMRQRLKDNAEEKLNSERENKALISNIAHDLKTPITAVKGYSEGIMDGVANTPEKVDKYVRTIYNKANEMDMLINELTLYSKIDTNRIPYNFA